MITRKQAQQISYNQVSKLGDFTHNSTLEKIGYFDRKHEGWVSIWRDRKLSEYTITVHISQIERIKVERRLLGYRLKETESLETAILKVWCEGNVGMNGKLAKMQTLLWKQLPLGRLTRLSKLLKSSLGNCTPIEFPKLYSAQRIHPVRGEVEFTAYTSTSKRRCFDTFGKKDGVCYILHNVRGYDLSLINPNEQEVLLLPNTRWKVINQSETKVTKFIEEVTWDSDPETISYKIPLYEVEPYI